MLAGGREIHVPRDVVPGLDQDLADQVLRAATLVGGHHVLVAVELLDRRLEVVEVHASRVRLVAQHHAGPLAVAHGGGPGVREQVDVDVLGPDQEHVPAGFLERRLALLPGGDLERLDHLDLPGLGPGTSAVLLAHGVERFAGHGTPRGLSRARRDAWGGVRASRRQDLVARDPAARELTPTLQDRVGRRECAGTDDARPGPGASRTAAGRLTQESDPRVAHGAGARDRLVESRGLQVRRRNDAQASQPRGRTCDGARGGNRRRSQIAAAGRAWPPAAAAAGREWPARGGAAGRCWPARGPPPGR